MNNIPYIVRIFNVVQEQMLIKFWHEQMNLVESCIVFLTQIKDIIEILKTIKHTLKPFYQVIFPKSNWKCKEVIKLYHIKNLGNQLHRQVKSGINVCLSSRQKAKYKSQRPTKSHRIHSILVAPGILLLDQVCIQPCHMKYKVNHLSTTCFKVNY